MSQQVIRTQELQEEQAYRIMGRQLYKSGTMPIAVGDGGSVEARLFEAKTHPLKGLQFVLLLLATENGHADWEGAELLTAPHLKAACSFADQALADLLVDHVHTMQARNGHA